jgi:hypothetical protein
VQWIPLLVSASYYLEIKRKSHTVLPLLGKNSHPYLKDKGIFCIFMDYEIFKPKTPTRRVNKTFVFMWNYPRKKTAIGMEAYVTSGLFCKFNVNWPPLN